MCIEFVLRGSEVHCNFTEDKIKSSTSTTTMNNTYIYDTFVVFSSSLNVIKMLY